jgi:hypothetical protein
LMPDWFKITSDTKTSVIQFATPELPHSLSASNNSNCASKWSTINSAAFYQLFWLGEFETFYFAHRRNNSISPRFLSRSNDQTRLWTADR